MFLVAYLLYQTGRSVGRGAYEQALDNAGRVLALERGTGADVERWLQGALSGAPWIDALNYVYLAAQPVVIPIVVVWLYRRAPEVYAQLRTTIITAWMISLPLYALFPTAPPRLAGIGIADTVTAGSGVNLDDGLLIAFYNPYAAVPSLHAGFAVAVGLAVAAAARRRALRAAGLAWGPLVILATVATGNHFLLDAAAGVAITALAYRLGRAHARQPAQAA